MMIVSTKNLETLIRKCIPDQHIELGIYMDMVRVRDQFIRTWILAAIYISVIVTGRGPDMQNYIHDPYIVSPERVQYGSDVNLTCYILIDVKFISFISFTWKKNDKRFIHGGNYEMSSGSGSFVNSRYKYYTNTLTLKATRMTDEGNRYMCQVDVKILESSSSFNTDEYIFGQEVPSTTSTTASEGEDVPIFLSWRVTDDVIRLWSPSGQLIATIQSISVYIWPNSRSKVKVIRLMTSTHRKTAELVICNATKGDAGRYYLRELNRRAFLGSYYLVIADRTSTKVTLNSLPYTEGQTKSETATQASTTSTSTQADVTPDTMTVAVIHTETATTAGIPLSTATPTNTDTNVTTVLYIIVGCCVLLIVLAVFILAASLLIRIKQQGYWNLRSRRLYITPQQNMPENVDRRDYAEILRAGALEVEEGNIVQPVLNIHSDDNVPPVCGARNAGETQQLERNCRKVYEDDEYEEVRPVDAINSEEHVEEQESKAQMHEDDQDIQEDITDEMNMIVPEASSYSDPMLHVAHLSVPGRDSGNITLGIINLFKDTGFVTQDTDEPWNAPFGAGDIERLPATVQIFPEVGRMTANNTGAHQLSMGGRGYNAENEPLRASSDTYDSLISHRFDDTYTPLKTLDDTTDD